MLARALIVLVTACLTGLFVGSGLAQLLAPTLTASPPRPLARLSVPEVVLPDTLVGGLFAPVDEAIPPPPPAGPEDVACEVPWRLAGTMIDRLRPARSFAAIHTPEGSQLIAVSMTHEELTLVSLEADSATLERSDGQRCTIHMFSTETVVATRSTSTTITALPDTPAPPEHPGIRRVSASHVELDPSVLGNLADLRVRAIPEMRGSQIAGVRVYGVRRTSPLAAAGLSNGDLISHIDGTEISSADIALTALGRLRGGEDVSVTVASRGGAPRQVTLSLARP